MTQKIENTLNQKRRFSIRTKIIVIVSSFLIPLSVMFAIFINSKMKDVDFAEMELKGNEYQRPLETLLSNIIAHRHFSLQKTSSGAFQKIESDINENLITLKDVDKRLGDDLQFREEGLAKRNQRDYNIDSLEEKVKKIVFSNAIDKKYPTAEQYDLIIDHINKMISHAGDISNLILDPDLDSYYLMDVTLLALPQLQNRLQETMVFLNQLEPGKPLTANEKTKLQIFLFVLKNADITRIVNSTASSLQEDQNFYGSSSTLKLNMQPNLDKLTVNISSLLNKLGVLAESNSSLDLGFMKDFNHTWENTLHSVFDYQKIAFFELDNLLHIRINTFVKEILYSLILVLFSIFVSLTISIMIGKSLIIPLNKVYKNLDNSSKNLNTKSKLLKSLSETVNSVSKEQEDLIHNTGAAVSQVTSMIGRTAQLTEESTHLADNIFQKASHGKVSIENMASSMEEIYRSSVQLKEIEKIILEIEKKTQVINDIVSKTELLSLNASIEAARAGEYGKGFSVVAEEVGNLAKLSGKSSSEINALLSQSRGQILSILGQTTERVKEGQERTNDMIVSFNEISEGIEQINLQTKDIADATKEQEISVQQISKAMTNIANLAVQNAQIATDSLGVAENIAQNGSEVQNIAESTRSVISGYKET